ncbi:PulJ/GspJ family protein [Rosistilla oblonga]|uniref:PulJ/GspJ family protein n=1 Tax=Rosistilla oblonga TaxID=2527990 RepID=UPI003A9731B5
MNNPTDEPQQTAPIYRRSPRRCTGFTLVELVVAMSFGSVVMLLAIGIVHQSLTFSQLGQARADQDRALVRLDRQFRQDVHRSEGFELPDPQTLELAIDDTRVVYTFDNNKIQRQTTADSKRQDRELFLLNDRSQIELLTLDAPQRLGIVVRSDPGLQGVPPRTDRQIIAAVGLLQKRMPSSNENPADSADSAATGDDVQ